MAKTKGGGLFKDHAIMSAGSIFGIIPQLLIGVCIILLGLYLLNDKNDKNDENDETEKTDKTEKNDMKFYLGIILLIFGTVLTIGIFGGFDTITDALFDQ